MNPHLGKHTVGVGILIGLISAPAYSQLSFKSSWYFTSEDLLTTPVGIQGDSIPFAEDRQLPSSESELSLADLQDRAEALGVWLGEMGVADSLQVTDANLDTPSSASAEVLASDAEEIPELSSSTDTPNPMTPPASCSGFYFSDDVLGQLYALAQEQELESLHTCVASTTHAQDFLLIQDERVVAQIQTHGEIETSSAVPSSFLQLLIQEKSYEAAIWIPRWNAPDEEIDIWVDGEIYPGPVLIQSDSDRGVQLFLSFEESGVKDIFLDNLLHNEQVSFLVHADPQLPQGIMVGRKMETEEDPVVEIKPQEDPAQFLEYYDESAGQFFPIAGSVGLDNAFLPHFFRYFDRTFQTDRTFLWTPRGELEDGYFELQEVLMALRTQSEVGLTQTWDRTADVVVVRSAPGQALPDLHRVEVSDAQKLTWKTLEETFVVENEDETLQIYVSPPEGQYWLSGPQDAKHQRVWVMQGVDTFVGAN